VEAALYPEMARNEEVHWWWLARRQILTRMLQRLSLPKDAAILEAGCGTGGNLEMLSHFGSLYGMELDDSARAISISRGFGKIESGRMPDEIPFHGKQFDLILLLDVLEHLDDDSGSLKGLYQRLKPGGWLLVTVPAFPFLWSQHDAAHHHKRRYRRKQLRATVEQAGYEIRYCSYFNCVLFPLITSIRVWKNTFGGSDDLAVPSSPVNRTLQALFASERHVIGKMRLPFGVSLILTAQRV